MRARAPVSPIVAVPSEWGTAVELHFKSDDDPSWDMDHCMSLGNVRRRAPSCAALEGRMYATLRFHVILQAAPTMMAFYPTGTDSAYRGVFLDGGGASTKARTPLSEASRHWPERLNFGLSLGLKLPAALELLIRWESFIGSESCQGAFSGLGIVLHFCWP